MGIIKRLGKIIQKFDFFNTTQFLRYQKQPQYESVFGGMLSLIILLGLLIAFSNRVIETVSMMSINSTTNSLDADDPVPLTISTFGEPRNFMFGVEIWHHNLNTDERIFDIDLINKNYVYGQASNKSVSYLLQACTLDHWRGYSKIQNKFNELNIGNWLCLPKDINYQIGGKYSSPIQNSVQVSVNKCTNTSMDKRPCANKSTIDSFFQTNNQKIYFTIYFINPLLNPDQADFLTYYLEDSNYIIFSQTGGEQAQIMMQDFTVKTDNSILPFSDYSSVTGGIIQKNAIKNRYDLSATDTTYCTFFIYKSPMSIYINRSYEKIDSILSYIGGLFGSIIAVLIIFSIYDNYSYEISIGSLLFKLDEKRYKFKKYNIFYFILHLFYKLFRSKLQDRSSWSKIKGYYTCRQELLKQLGVDYLLNRIIFLQRAISIMLSDHQFKGLYLLKQLTLQQAKINRKRFKLKNKIIDRLQQLSKNIQKLQTNDNNNKIKIQNDNSLHIIPSTFQIQVNNKNDTIINKQQHQIQKQQNNIEDSDSDSYSQQQIQIDDKIISQLFLLKKQKNQSLISSKIYQNLNQQLKQIIDKYDQIQILNNNQIQNQNQNLIHKINIRQRKKNTQLPSLNINPNIQIVQDISNNINNFQQFSDY